MNQHYAVMAIQFFLFGLGLFNLARGAQIFRKRKTKKWLGILRALVGVPFVALPFALHFYLRMFGKTL